jgi:D-3-phosphoglycerate dehydrogenase / 2-oxoglutarate reductase
VNTLKNCHVLVTATSFGKDDPLLRTRLEANVGKVTYNPFGRPCSSDELQSLIQDVDGMIAGLDQIDRPAIEKASRLKIIARYGVGYDRVDITYAHEKDIIVTFTPGANAVSVAELAIGLMLCLAREIPSVSEATKAGAWPRLSGISLAGKKIGILGLGAIGKAVAKRLAGFECQILAHDIFVDQEFVKENNIQVVDVDSMLPEVDFLSLHLPVTKDTKGLVNASFLSRMKAGSFLVNTARGELVDEKALIDALHSGHLRGAGLDAFYPEPPYSYNPLLSMKNVIATPHAGAHSDSATKAMGEMALADCMAVLAGGQPAHPVK